MSAEAVGSCAECGYPLAASSIGEKVSCPMCSTVNEAISGVSVPDPLFWGLLGIGVGVILAKSKYIGQQLARI